MSFGETGNAFFIQQSRVVDVNMRPLDFCSCVLGAWNTSVNKAKILVLIEFTFLQREIVNSKNNKELGSRLRKLRMALKKRNVTIRRD